MTMLDETKLPRFFLATFILFSAVSMYAQPKNLFLRGDFTSGSRVDNLWDGVSSNNLIQIQTIQRAAPRENATLSGVPMPVSAVMADVTNDGLDDIVAGSPEGYIWVFVNSGEPGKPQFTRGEIIPVIPFIPARWSKDGLSSEELHAYVPRLDVTRWSSPVGFDLVVGTFYGEVFRVPLYASGGKITFRNFDPNSAEIKLSGTPNFYCMNLVDPVVVDWNGDGRKDLVLGEGSFSANTVWFLENTGTDSNPKFESQNRVQLIEALGNMQLKPAVIDWNNDGRLDLFVVDEKGDAVIYLRQSDGSLGEAQSVLAGAGNFGNMSSVKPADFNADGKFDLLIGRSNGAIQVALNIGSLESPAFSAPTPVAGTDVLLPYQRPLGWSLNAAEHVPYSVMEVFNDPTNVAVPEASGGNCLRFYFLDPQNKIVEGQITRSLTPSHTIRSGSINLQTGKTYEISFRYASTGFNRINWSMIGVIYSKDQREATVTRRGEQTVGGQSGRLGLSEVRGQLGNSSWSNVRQTIRVPDLPNSRERVAHDLVFSLQGIGDFRLDDVVVVEK